MEAARGGDRGALDALLRRHYDRLYAVCRRMTGDPTDAADACQEALLAIVRGLPGFDGRSAFATWAYRVATNACLDELRRRRRRPEPGLPEGRDEAWSATDDTEGAATRIDLDVALQSLPADYRAAVVLRDVCGLSYDEIAVALVIPPGTVRSRIARGRAALVPLLAPGRNQGPPAERPTST
ncbi:MAG TPA: sigma-70 family RNA polymerase sigma factor [Acidimicrobiales bacterium]|nr:sigma-70 family RNA polymerase sigma factor [Acidimicrobiales bacterium]